MTVYKYNAGTAIAFQLQANWSNLQNTLDALHSWKLHLNPGNSMIAATCKQ